MKNDNINPELVQATLEKFDLAWAVKKRDNFFQDGDGNMHPSGTFSIVRDDTNTHFCDKSNRYEIFQNWELVELIYKVSQNFDMEIDRGGHLDGGGKVYLQVKSNDIKGIGENNDIVNGWITTMNAHDGTASTQWGQTNVTVSCANTFHAAVKDMTNRFSHSKNMRDRIDQSLRQLENSIAEEKTLFETFMKFAEVPMTQQLATKTVQLITGVDASLSPSKAQEEYGTKRFNKAAKLIERIGEEVSYKGHTLWGLFSGVTSYTNKDLPKEGEEIKQKLVGTANKIDNKVYSMLAEIIA